MLRHAITTAALVVLAVVPAQAAVKGKAKAPSSVSVLECKRGDSPDARNATFLARMRSLPGSDRMLMRFTLLERFGDEKAHPVRSPELRLWRSSKPGVRDFRFKQTVTALQGGGEYWARVDFRWLDAAGNLLRKKQRVSNACQEPGELANLVVGTPTAQLGPENTAVYLVPIGNAGRAPAQDVVVALSVDGADTNVARVDSIAPGATREVRFAGPLCQHTLRVEADPADSVKERHESDNVAIVACPPLAR
jgi:hypothetical protein